MSVESVLVVLGSAAVGAAGGAFLPRVLAALPEPAAEPGDRSSVKPPYAQLARTTGLRAGCAVAAGLVCGVVGWRLGWSAALPAWLVLGVVGVLLAYIDWRTRLLPTRVVVPTYAVVGGLLLLASLVTGDWSAALRALIAGVVVRGLFWLLWLIYPKGMGFGDVRLSGVLALALGWLGWGEVVLGTYSGFLLGAVIGGGLALAKIVDRRHYPFGPFMLLGALIGLVWGDAAAAYLG